MSSWFEPATRAPEASALRIGIVTLLLVAHFSTLAGVPIDSVRGGRTARYVVASAADGYRVVFSLAELAPDLTGRVVLLADERDGKALAGDEGPLRLVLPDDTRPTRWIRQLTSLTVRQAAR